ncbi:hypothetical protein OIU91_06060 [Streptomyces sp. NBC_01456]|uniref:hypothetical protein n=1 Tax=unclassified Streptomyces TaxID=2593676 RepID=UPI002E3751A5|nr:MULTISPECIES: hypothetical protein [unclassified Streptomyces]
MFGKTPEEKQAIVEMKAADKALHENSDREFKAGIRDETPEYQRLNRIANEKAAKVPRMFGGTKRGR